MEILLKKKKNQIPIRDLHHQNQAHPKERTLNQEKIQRKIKKLLKEKQEHKKISLKEEAFQMEQKKRVNHQAKGDLRVKVDQSAINLANQVNPRIKVNPKRFIKQEVKVNQVLSMLKEGEAKLEDPVMQKRVTQIVKIKELPTKKQVNREEPVMQRRVALIARKKELLIRENRLKRNQANLKKGRVPQEVDHLQNPRIRKELRCLR